MAIVFLNTQGVLLTHYVPKNINVNSVYYRKVLFTLKADFCRKWLTAFLDELGLFFHIRLIRLMSHPVIFGYSCALKIFWVASILQMICR